MPAIHHTSDEWAQYSERRNRDCRSESDRSSRDREALAQGKNEIAESRECHPVGEELRQEGNTDDAPAEKGAGSLRRRCRARQGAGGFDTQGTLLGPPGVAGRQPTLVHFNPVVALDLARCASLLG